MTERSPKAIEFEQFLDKVQEKLETVAYNITWISCGLFILYLILSYTID